MRFLFVRLKFLVPPALIYSLIFLGCANRKYIPNSSRKLFVTGCGNFQVVSELRIACTRKPHLVIHTDGKKIHLTNYFREFQIENQDSIFGYIVSLNKVGRNYFCTDANDRRVKEGKRWTLKSGTIKIKINTIFYERAFHGFTPFSIDLVLSNAIFYNGNQKIEIKEFIFSNVEVNYLMG